MMVMSVARQQALPEAGRREMEGYFAEDPPPALSNGDVSFDVPSIDEVTRIADRRAIKILGW